VVLVGVLVGLVAAVAVGYVWLLLRVGPAPNVEPIAGETYRVGGCCIHRLPAASDAPATTVIAMHGFLQSPAYFVDLYRDCPDTEVLLVGSCDYHAVLATDEDTEAPWYEKPAYPSGTIAYDASVLLQAWRHLATGRSVCIHGHSRGGAVVVEAARQAPSRFEGVRVVLETPVLPQGRLFQPLPWWLIPLLPGLLPLWRRHPINAYNEAAFGQLNDERKRRLVEAMPFNARRAWTIIRNLRDIDAWSAARDVTDVAYLRQGAVLISTRDRILDSGAMQGCAGASGAPLGIERARGVSHLMSLDRPEIVREAVFR